MSPLLHHYIILHPRKIKIGNSFVIRKCLHFTPGPQSAFYTDRRKNLLKVHIIGKRCNVLLQGSSHVMFLLMFILFVSRQKSEKSLDIHLYVYMYFCFICYWFYLCRIVLSMIIIVYVKNSTASLYTFSTKYIPNLYCTKHTWLFMVNWIFHRFNDHLYCTVSVIA